MSKVSSKPHRTIESTPTGDGSGQMNSGLETRCCPVCGNRMDRKPKKSKVCSRVCWGRSPERIKAVRKAHRKGNYAPAHEAAKEHMRLRPPERKKEIQANGLKTRRKLGYAWMRGKRNPMNRMDADTKREFFANHSAKMQKYWTDPQWVANHLEKAGRPANGFEKRLIRFFQKKNLPFKFSGDWNFWVGSPCQSGKTRNPDFVLTRPDHPRWKAYAEKNKRAVLAHGHYWHRDSKAVQRELNDYRGEGWEVFIIWDNTPLNDLLAERIRLFAGLSSGL